MEAVPLRRVAGEAAAEAVEDVEQRLEVTRLLRGAVARVRPYVRLRGAAPVRLRRGVARRLVAAVV